MHVCLQVATKLVVSGNIANEDLKGNCLAGCLGSDVRNDVLMELTNTGRLHTLFQPSLLLMASNTDTRV
jgi:hypothetical protein